MKHIQPGMKACASDGTACTVIDVLVDPHTMTERSIVLGANGYFGPDVVAPVSAVWCVDDRVHLELSAADIAALPPFNHATHCHDAGLFSRVASRHAAHRPHVVTR